MSDTTTTLPSETYKIDSVHSTVSFKIRHNAVVNFRGTFEGVSGTLENGVLSGSVQATNINVGPIEAFKNHLVSADFFHAEKHPTIDFKSTSIAADGEQLKFTGDFTLKGVTKSITGSGVARGPQTVDTGHGEVTKLGLDITAVINRNDFNLGPAGYGDDVTIEISLALDKA